MKIVQEREDAKKEKALQLQKRKEEREAKKENKRHPNKENLSKIKVLLYILKGKESKRLR